MNGQSFAQTLREHGLTKLVRGQVKTLQVNVGKLCNMACHHCHVEAGPKRTEIMSAPVAGVAAAQQPAETSIPDKVRLFIPYKDYAADDNKCILEMYKWLRVADVSDGMDVVGLQNIGLVDQEVHALWKDTEKFTHRTVGIAVTARYVPTNRREPKMDDKTIGRWYGTITSEAFMKVLQPGSMLVIDAMDDGESRSIGSSNILAWKKLGMVGLVTGGGLADTDESGRYSTLKVAADGTVHVASYDESSDDLRHRSRCP